MVKSKKKIKLFICGAIIFIICLLQTITIFATDNDFSYYNGKTIGVSTGTVQEKYVKEIIPDAILKYYANYADMALATSQGKCDACVIPGTSLNAILKENPTLVCDEKVLAYDYVCFGFPKSEDGDFLRNQMNEFLADYKASDEFESDRALWFSEELSENIDPIDFSTLPAENGIINYGAVTLVMPFCYRSGDGFLGYDTTILYKFCKKYGYGIRFEDTPVVSAIAGATTGIYDMVGGAIVATPERRESINFSDSYYDCPQVIVVKDPSLEKTTNVFTSIGDKFKKAFITENRWKLIASGLLVTVIISICAFIFATIVGAGLAYLMLSKSKVLNTIANGYHRIMQGVPVLVILMIFYYVFFARISISGIIVSIIVFGLHSGSTLGELFKGGVMSADKGEIEAAYALGLNKTQIFFGIIFPQFIRSIMVGYRSAFISLVMGTSIVGYVAVEDLTKATDIIRGRTFEAFLPLIITAIIYFLITFAITKIINSIFSKTDPKLKRDKQKEQLSE